MTTTIERVPHLDPAQRAITYGSCWMRPVNMDKHFIYFGRVFDHEDLGLEESKTTAAQALVLDRVYGETYSRFNPDGVVGLQRRIELWPIDTEVFDLLVARRFDTRNLQGDEASVLTKPMTEWVQWQQGWKPVRRDYAEFLAEVEQLVRIATAHNHGQTYYGANRTNDREVVLRMSSWPRAQEAIEALLRHRFHARRAGNTSLVVRDRSEDGWS